MADDVSRVIEVVVTAVGTTHPEGVQVVLGLVAPLKSVLPE